MSMTRTRILETLRAGRLDIRPFNEDQLSVASYDVTLDSDLLVYTDVAPDFVISGGAVLDAAADNPAARFPIPGAGYVLVPGELYIASTAEWIHLAGVEAIVDGRSSFGRLGLSIHQTAGYLDPGFRGQVTLEMTVIKPLRVYRGMRVGQLRFFTPEGPIAAYQGKYVDQQGPTPSRSWMDTIRT